MYIVLINSATMLDSPVLHLHGKKKKRTNNVHMVWLRNKKTDFQVGTLIWRAVYHLQLQSQSVNIVWRLLVGKGLLCFTSV